MRVGIILLHLISLLCRQLPFELSWNIRRVQGKAPKKNYEPKMDFLSNNHASAVGLFVGDETDHDSTEKYRDG